MVQTVLMLLLLTFITKRFYAQSKYQHQKLVRYPALSLPFSKEIPYLYIVCIRLFRYLVSRSLEISSKNARNSMFHAGSDAFNMVLLHYK